MPVGPTKQPQNQVGAAAANGQVVLERFFPVVGKFSLDVGLQCLRSRMPFLRLQPPLRHRPNRICTKGVFHDLHTPRHVCSPDRKEPSGSALLGSAEELSVTQASLAVKRARHTLCLFDDLVTEPSLMAKRALLPVPGTPSTTLASRARHLACGQTSRITGRDACVTLGAHSLSSLPR